MWDDNDDHGEENNRFQDHTEDQGSESNNYDHDDDEGKVVEKASGEKEIRTRRGRVVKKPDRFRP